MYTLASSDNAVHMVLVKHMIIKTYDTHLRETVPATFGMTNQYQASLQMSHF